MPKNKLIKLVKMGVKYNRKYFAINTEVVYAMAFNINTLHKTRHLCDVTQVLACDERQTG